MKCKLADKVFYMAVKSGILNEEEKGLKETVRFYGYENITPKAKITLAQMIAEIEKGIKENKNG